MKIRGATALVTGANRGIGQQLVRALLGEGANRVYACARSISSLSETLQFDSSRVVCLELDVTKAADIAHAASTAKDVTLVINNAAILNFGTAAELTEQDLLAHMLTNVHGMFGMSKAFGDVVAANGGGAIANVLSLIALHNEPNMAAYSATKAAAWSLTQSIRASFRSRGIDVHAIFPGPVDTRMLAQFPMQKATPLSVAQEIVAGVDSGQDLIYPDPVSKLFKTRM